MKRLLLNSILLCLWIALVFFSCADPGSNRKSEGVANSDSAGKNQRGAGNTVNGQQTNTVNTGRDTALQYKREIRNNGPDQQRIDSIKNAKTKKKK
jgi:hypothetical protein